MNIYLWRHNKTYHSHSMIEEPCINNEFYLDALCVVAAESLDEALELLAKENKGWRVEDLRALSCQVIPLVKPCIVFEELRGTVHHL